MYGARSGPVQTGPTLSKLSIARTICICIAALTTHPLFCIQQHLSDKFTHRDGESVRGFEFIIIVIFVCVGIIR